MSKERRTLVLALRRRVTAAPAVQPEPHSRGEGIGVSARVVDLVDTLLAVPLHRVAMAGMVAIALVVALGLLALLVLPWGSTPYRLFNLDGERGVPAALNGALLLAAGLIGFLTAPASIAYRLLALGFTYAAFDEVFALHEALQRVTGVNWIKLYLPVFLAALVLAAVLLRMLRRDAPQSLPFFVAGVLLWSGAQSLEWFEWLGTDVPQPGYETMMVVEELLEDLGSLALLLATLVLGRAAMALSRTAVDGAAAAPSRARSASRA